MSDVEKGDDFLRDKIQAPRAVWSAAAFDGAKSGFLIAVVSSQLAEAKPNETVASLCRKLLIATTQSVATMLPRPGSTRGDSRRREGTSASLERDDRQRFTQ